MHASIRPVGVPGGPPGQMVPTEDAISAYDTIFMVSFGILVVLLVVAQWLPGKVVARDLQEERRVEAAELESALTVGMEA